MGASNSTEDSELKRKAEKLQKQKDKLEAEKERLQRQQREYLEAEKKRLEREALNQEYTALRLLEEQRRTEAAEKCLREQQQKEAYDALQRQVDELKIQQQLQLEQQKKIQLRQPSAPLPTSSREPVKTKESVPLPTSSQEPVKTKESVPLPTISREPVKTKESVPEQRRVSPSSKSKKIPSDTTATVRTSAPTSTKPTQGTSSGALLGASAVIPKHREALPQVKLPEPCESRAETRKVPYRAWSIVDYVDTQKGVSKSAIANVVKLLDDGNTTPFIARYRKHMTQGLALGNIRTAKHDYERAKTIKKRAFSIIKDVRKNGSWTPEFQAFVLSLKSLEDLDYAHSIFKVKNARAVELETVARAVIAGEKIAPLSSFVKTANEEQVKDRLVYILADTMNKDIRVFDLIKNIESKCPINVKTKLVEPDTNVAKTERKFLKERYAKYDNFVSAMSALVPSEIAYLNKGESQKVLSVEITVPSVFDDAFKARCLKLFGSAVKASASHEQLINAAIDRMYNTWIKPFIKKKKRIEMNERAKQDEIDSTVDKIRDLLLTAPMAGKCVISLYSISESVSKVAAVSDRGILLGCETIDHHDTNNLSAKYDTEKMLVRMVHKYKCTCFAVSKNTPGNTMMRNINFIEDLIKKKAFGPLEVSYGVVDDVGLSSYVRSVKATLEFPRIDDKIIATVALARRLQNPIAELVKIEPEGLVPASVLQEIPEIDLISKIEEALMEAVSFFGVDVNNASVDLLKRVPGLDEAKGTSIAEWRESFGPFANRQDLFKVKGISDKVFEQCAGFIRIVPETAVGNDGRRFSQDSFNYLDQTTIHPESYGIARAFVEAAKCDVNQLGTGTFVFAVMLFASQDHGVLAKKFGTTKHTIEQIVSALKVDRAPIATLEGPTNVNTTSTLVQQKIKPKLPVTSSPVNPKRSKTSLPVTSSAAKTKSKPNFDDFIIGTVLTGVVTEVNEFGAFVSVGMDKPGLIHNAFMNGITLTVRDKVVTIVNAIDRERRVFRLRLIKCI